MRVLLIICVDVSRKKRSMSADMSEKNAKCVPRAICMDRSVCLHVYQLLKSLCCISNQSKMTEKSSVAGWAASYFFLFT